MAKLVSFIFEDTANSNITVTIKASDLVEALEILILVVRHPGDFKQIQIPE